MLGLAFFLGLIVSSEAQPPQDPSAYMKQIWSPYCKGVSLMECPSTKAEILRNEIYSRMEKGETFEKVFADLSERYGASLRMSPEFEGREAAAFWIPWLMAIAVALLVLTVWMTRKRRRIPTTATSYRPAEALEARIQKELHDLRD